MNNQTDVSIKFKNSVTGEKKLEKYAQTLSQIKSVLGSIDKGAAAQLEQSTNKTKDMSKDMDKMSKNFNLAFNYSALRAFARGLGHVVESFSSMTAKSTAFLEDFNLFQVAFRGNYTEATRFVNKLSEMYGLDEDWLIKTTAKFKQLANAMGLADETGEKLSKMMTLMSIDISSLYNKAPDVSSSILESALAGQTKPARRLGADITQATLQQTLDKLNLDTQVSQLSYVEKRLLIVISLAQQLSDATDDWGRTLESPANQIRIMNEQWQRLQRNVGNIFLQVVGKVLPYLNAVLMVLNEIAKVIAALFGYKLDDFDFFDETAIGGLEGGFDDLGDSIDSAADSAKKLKQGLRGFDKLNVITTPSSGGTGGAGGIGGGGGISSGLMDAFNKAFDDYNKKLSEVQMKATKIRDRIMEWLGFQKYINKETGETYFKFKKITGGTILGALAVGGSIFLGIKKILGFLERIGLIKIPSLTNLVKLLGGTKATGTLAKLTAGFTKLASALGVSTGALAAIVAAIVAIVAALVHAYITIDEFRKKVNDAFSSVITLYVTIMDKLAPIIKGLFDLWLPLLEQGLSNVKTIIGVLYDNLVTAFSMIADTINGVAKIVTDIINLDFAQALTDLKEMFKNLYEDFITWRDKINKRIEDWAKELIERLTTNIDKMKKKIQELPEMLDKLPDKAGEAIGRMIRKIYDFITQTDWKAMGRWIIEHIVEPLANIAGYAYNSIVNLPSKIWNFISNEIWRIDWWSLGNRIVEGIINGMYNFGSKISNWANEFVNGLKRGLGIHSPAKLILDAKIGDFSMEAITLGMERQLPLLQDEAQNIVDTLKSGIKEASIDSNFAYDIPPFNPNTMTFGVQSMTDNGIGSNTSINPTIIVQVGNKDIAKQVITDLQDMAKDNGKPIVIGG